ncbi:sensor histidine kinase [Plebeiibacterium sediminum]|uniref:histidine kinase n=1 Tax=Plebeiibacterium sediminum TaxID=2992112 RepID=A0AAE3M8Y3_9BACT|nr:HAMP domain-containing sensor histidine kinase [Plebeiobacterium sediminum]MCW3789117.1 HAMP domain-containing histidine kinase [Plebeiobacterium sediminum]
MRYHSFLSKEDAAWGEQEVIRFRWVLIAAIIVLIGYIFLSGNTQRGLISLGLALIYIFYNSIINILLSKFDNASWIRYVSSTIDVTILSAHIFNYSYFFKPIAVSTAPSLFLYAVLIMLSVLRYDGRLVIFTTIYVVICSNVIYFLRYQDIDPYLFTQVASAGPEGAIYRSVYFLLMGYFMFSIPKMINRLVEKQNATNNERREIEIKLALETQKKDMAMQSLIIEQQLSEQLNNQKEVILEQNNSLEKLITTKNKLFSIIGHDLRSPLCVQSSLTEYLIHDFNNLDKENILESIYAIHKTANNALNMLSNLMDWSRTQNNMLDPVPIKVNIKQKLEDVIDLQSESWRAKKINIKVQSDIDLYSFADDQMVETILRNLLSNAIKFTPENGNVHFSAYKKDHSCIIEVSDTGVGMSERQLKALFSSDKTISLPGTNNEKGTGLGLILCKEMIDINKGTISVDSELSKGTKFTISLPTEN